MINCGKTVNKDADLNVPAVTHRFRNVSRSRASSERENVGVLVGFCCAPASECDFLATGILVRIL